jgi:hypothetical protein
MAVIDNDGIAILRQRVAPADNTDDPDARILVKMERVGYLDGVRVQCNHPPQILL